jgi:choline dehydrogenase-like flavoprotein
MLIDARKINKSQRFDADVCIMGGGVAGVIIANELIKEGRTVVLLEAGDDRHNKDAQLDASAEYVSSPYPDPQQSRVRQLGGTSTHWANNTSPLSSIDFEKRDGLPMSGWPIKKSDLEPYYALAGIYCGVGDEGYDLEYWLEYFKKNKTLPDNYLGALSLGVAKAAVPPTQLYYDHGSNIKNHKDAQVVTFAHVVDVSFSAATKKINNVIFSNPAGVKSEVHATQFIMAFGGLENARMLLHFNQKNNNQLGNQGDCVGRYFMDHPTLKGAHVYSKDPSAFSFFDGEITEDYKRFALNFFELNSDTLRQEGITNLRLPMTVANRRQLSHGISSLHILKDRLKGIDMSGELASHITNVVMDFDVVADTLSRKVLNKPLMDSVDEPAGFEVSLMMEQTPHRDNRISLGNSKDRFGVPKMRVDWQLHDDDKARLWKGLNIFSRELGALGLGRVRSLEDRASRIFSDQIGFGHHHMGATRMSENPNTGVVDKEHKVFGTDNLSMAGCSVFSTGSHVPPTLTIAAMSIRLAKIIKNNL